MDIFMIYQIKNISDTFSIRNLTCSKDLLIETKIAKFRMGLYRRKYTTAHTVPKLDSKTNYKS